MGSKATELGKPGSGTTASSAASSAGDSWAFPGNDATKSEKCARLILSLRVRTEVAAKRSFDYVA